MEQIKNFLGVNKAREADIISGAAATISGTYDLGKGYKARIDVGHVQNDQRHVHIFKKGEEVANQNNDGSPHYKNKNELRRIFRLKKHEAIAQRISLQYHLSGLTADETKAYVRHQMQTAGMATPLFSDSAVSRVHAASQGIPRLINHFCSQALYDAGQRAMRSLRRPTSQGCWLTMTGREGSQGRAFLAK